VGNNMLLLVLGNVLLKFFFGEEFKKGSEIIVTMFLNFWPPRLTLGNATSFRFGQTPHAKQFAC